MYPSQVPLPFLFMPRTCIVRANRPLLRASVPDQVSLHADWPWTACSWRIHPMTTGAIIRSATPLDVKAANKSNNTRAARSSRAATSRRRSAIYRSLVSDASSSSLRSGLARADMAECEVEHVKTPSDQETVHTMEVRDEALNVRIKERQEGGRETYHVNVRTRKVRDEALNVRMKECQQRGYV